jgi:membrane-associated phospholipid phosphatase
MYKSPSMIRQSKMYFLSLLTILLCCTIILVVNGQSAGFIAAGSYHPFLLNAFFVNCTFLGDGIFALCLTAVILFYYKRKQQGLALLFSFLISGIAIQIIKNLLVNTTPVLFFEAGQYLHYTDVISAADNSGLPSGHTATAFAIATVMVLLMNDKSWQLLILIAAVLVGYSRIYLAQHFLPGIILGAIIGSTAGVVSVYLAKNIKGIGGSIKKMHRLSSSGTSSSPSSSIQPV